jgi:hypothetical protein
MLRPKVFTCLLAGLIVTASTAPAQTARQFYEELYKASGLDRMADGYACFDDSPELQNFFIFGQSENIRELLEEHHAVAKLPKREQARLKKGYLIVRGYSKGVALSSEEMYDKDGDSWVTETYHIQNTPMRVRLSITWATLRYRKSVEMLNASGGLKGTVDRYGRCEAVSPDVQQKGE